MTLHTNFRWGLTGVPQEMLVNQGQVVARGTSVTPETAVTQVVDHEGRLLFPSFIDNHCHILPTGLNLSYLNLGPTRTVEEALDLIRDQHRCDREGWLVAVHYDHNRYGRHIERAELDRISDDRPILLRHSSGHAGIANTGAFVANQIDESTADPDGGTFVRGADGRLSGLLLETALERVTQGMGAPSLEKMVDAILEAGTSMARWGIAAASDMQTGRIDLVSEALAYKMAADQGCAIATRLYVEWDGVFGPNAEWEEAKEVLSDAPSYRCRAAGVKLFADGAIGAGTAAMHEPYQDQGGNGLLIYPPDELKSRIRTAADAGFQVAVHSIGDRCTDLVLDAFSETDDPSRHRLEHAMLLSDAQVERIGKLGCYVTFQPEFLLRFGETYEHKLGKARASKLLRSRTLLDSGIKLSFSSDRPVTSGSPWDGIAAASNRPHGFDPRENCSRSEAMECYTKAAASANGDDHLMGTLLPGTRADFHLIDADSL